MVVSVSTSVCDISRFSLSCACHQNVGVSMAPHRYSMIYTQVKTVPVLASDRFWRVAAALLAFVTVAAMYARFVAHARHVDDRASP